MENKKFVFYDFDHFEDAIIQTLLCDEESSIRHILDRQYQASKHDKKREFSGAGFFTDFSVPDDVERIKTKTSFHLDNIIGKVNDIPVGFILFVVNGTIDYLEGFTEDDVEWPDVILTYELQPFKIPHV